MTTAEPPSSSRIKNQILTDNTAQAVLKHLKANQSNRRRTLARWIWELLQNARDTSRSAPDPLVASITYEDGDLVFQHTGRPFTMSEVGHLIFHGSTKTEDDDTIGQYGSGFLTTHLISPQVDVSGHLDDDRTFQFTIRREDGSVQELSRSMDSAWDEFTASLSGSPQSQRFTTRFRYPVTEDSVDAVENGLDALKRCAPFVMVFNPEFSTIEARFGSALTTFRRITERPPVDQCAPSLVTVLEDRDGHEVQVDYLVKSSHRTSVTVAIERDGQAAACTLPPEIPRLFLGFPLTGTESFSFPAVVNSFDFTPTEARDGIFLAMGPNEGNLRNQAIIEEACRLTVDLTCFAAAHRLHHTYVLANIPKLESCTWLNLEWFRGTMRDFVKKIREHPAVIGTKNEPLCPRDSRLPVADTREGVRRLWGLLHKCKELRHLLPARGEAPGWAWAVKSWAEVETAADGRAAPSPPFDEIVDGEVLANRTAAGATDLQGLQSLLYGKTDALEWLDRLHGFLKDNHLQKAVVELDLVLNQEGDLYPLSELEKDCAIDEKLKKVAHSLDWPIRKKLRHVGLKSLADEEGAGRQTNEYVSRKLIRKLRDRNTPAKTFRDASARLFALLARRGDWEQLRDFPVFACDQECTTMRTDDKDPPLGPVRTWPEDLQPFADIFPPSLLMAEDFFKRLPKLAVWEKLVEENLVRGKVLAERSVYLEEALKSESLPDGDHKVNVEVTDVFRHADVIDHVSNSEERARLYWRFVVEWLVKHDAKGLDIQDVDCECGQAHKFCSAAWLEPLRMGGRRWIRLGNTRHYTSPESLAKLLKGEAGAESARAPTMLLDAIGVSVRELMLELNSEGGEERKQLDRVIGEFLAATGCDRERMQRAIEHAEDLEQDDGLAEAIEKLQEERRMADANSALGRQVEELVKECLEATEFVVRRTGIGSDFEIQLGERTWLVEVKSTRGQQSVRMTTRQAREAAARGTAFLLCVVPVGAELPGLEEVRKGMRFVENIGEAVGPLCRGLDELEHLRRGVQLELTPDDARVRVASSVWEKEGFPLEDLADRLAAQ